MSVGMNSDPLRVCSFESRRASEMRSLIERMGALADVAPSMKEIPLDENRAAFDFAAMLFQQSIQIVVFMTGVGAKALLEVLETRYSRPQLLAELEKTTIVVRGPKPTPVLRSWPLKIDFRAAEPNTWKEILDLFDNSIPIKGQRIAIQEYGKPSFELYRAFEQRGASILRVPVYRWALPDDVRPLQESIRSTIAGKHDVLMFTSAQQLNNVLEVARNLGLEEQWRTFVNSHCKVASIGPTATETIRGENIRVDLEPSHPTMGALVKETIAAFASKTTLG